jgi:hypothetical protein
MSLEENLILKPGLGDSPIASPCRVLMVDEEHGVVVLIELPGALGASGKKISHIRGPRQFQLSDLEAGIRGGSVVVTTYEAPAHWSMSDEDYLNASATEKEKERRKYRLSERDRLWELIYPVVGERSIQEIARNPTRLRARVLKQAESAGVNVTTVYRTLHKYLSSGGVRSGLIPDTHLRGAPGRRKVHTTKLGRKPRLEKSEESDGPGYVISEQDCRRMANGYLMAGKRMTEHQAFVQTSGVFWSTLRPNEKPELLPQNQRPTFAQFKYWGRTLNNLDDRKTRMGVAPGRVPATPGSTQDQVCAVGQMAMIDSTSSDVYLVSMMSRRKKLPPMRRTTVKEMRSTAVIGFYMGWEPVSSWTALQAILCAAEDKAEVCRRFDIPINVGDWPGMVCKLNLADNGEMKANVITEAELEFRFGVEYVRSYSGQSKSDVENQHHTEHKRLDHKVPGTTRGKQRERGEPHPADEALWNYYEYMHEYLLMIIAYNNEEVPHLAPTAMIQEGIAPTRINILKWMMAKNMRADIPCSIEHLRAYTMPSVPAVMTRNGVHLLMPDGRRHVPRARFYSPEMRNSPEFLRAVKTGGSVEIKIKLKKDDLSQIWFTLPTGLARIPNVQLDDDMQHQGTLPDLIQWLESEDLRKDKGRQERDQAELDMLLRREAKTAGAKAELKQELAALGKKPAKAEARSNLKKNVEEELALLESNQSDARGSSTNGGKSAGGPKVDAGFEAADNAMDAFMAELNS